MSDAVLSRHEIIKAAFLKWIPRLGLAWWDIEIVYYDAPQEIIVRFRAPDDGMVAATATVKWIYGTARINVNLPALEGLNDDELERIAVHELCHILVNEIREGELHHEERVVTTLTKAFFWVEDFSRDDAADNVVRSELSVVA